MQYSFENLKKVEITDPSSLFATIGTMSWRSMPDYLQEPLADLNVLGEDTIVAIRHWVLKGDELYPVVVGENEE